MRMPARGGAAFSIAIRFASASIIRCRSADLVGVLTNIRLPEHSTMRRAPAMPLFRRQSAAERTSHAPHDSKARLRLVTTRRDSWRSHVHRTYTAQRVQLFELQSGNVGGRGGLPSPFSGGSKGGILFGKRIPPLPRVPTAVGQNTAPFGHPKREYSFRCMNKKRSTNKRKLRITYHEQNENRYDHCLRTA